MVLQDISEDLEYELYRLFQLHFLAPTEALIWSPAWQKRFMGSFRNSLYVLLHVQQVPKSLWYYYTGQDQLYRIDLISSVVDH